MSSQITIELFPVLLARGESDSNIPREASGFRLERDVVYRMVELL